METVIIASSVFGIAFVFSMFGMGGGLFYMPFFLLFFAPAEASFLSYICIFVTACSSFSAYQQKKLVDWKLVGFLGVPLVTMVFLSGLFLKHLPAGFLKPTLGITLILAGVLMIVSFPKPGGAGIGEFFARRFPDKKYAFFPGILSPVTMLVGFLCGISGVAGGVFEIPLMAGVLRVGPHAAVATSSAIVFLAALLGFGGRLAAFGPELARQDFSALFTIVLLAFGGGRLGPRVAVKIGKPAFKKICGVFILIIGLSYLINAR